MLLNFISITWLPRSECVGRSGAKNARAREAGSINQSLLTLGRVITALVDHHGHIPYRDSKLTRLLQESLGGKAKTCIIATLSPSQLAVEESLSTLDYASKAKSIKNVPQVNQKMTKKTVMKEYCAEIESLRNMLQITREKNGIYVDPATFENMEARLSSQELQIAECESVLQERVAELKTIKTEVDTVKEQYAEVKTDLTVKTEQLDETEKNLAIKTEESDQFQMEWQASEAVIAEQEVTEESLSSHVTTLQTNVTHCNDDISGLFGKIDRHSAKEQERISQTEQYSAEVNSKQNALIASITNSLSESQTQSQELCAGVGSMLSKGKNVCSEFEQSIAQALVVLVGDTTVSKDSMVESCSDLNNTLSGTQKEVIDSLKTLQANLSSWLGDVQTNMTNTQSILTRQQNTLEEFKEAISTSNQEFQAKNEEFVTVQQEFSTTLQADMSELKTDISNHVATFQKDVHQTAEDNKALLKKKSMALQKAMQELLGDLVDTQDTHTDQVVQNVDSFASTLTTTAEEGIEKLSTATHTANNNLMEVNSSLSANVEQASAHFAKMVEGTQTIRQEIGTEIQHVASNVGQKRDFLDETTTTLSASVSQSITTAHAEVQKTASTAENMVDNVTEASQKMQSSCSESMHSFTEFLSGKGEEINAELINHFDVLKGTLSADMEIIQTVTAESQDFLNQTTEGVLQPTGTTPVKKAAVTLQEVESTRPHDAIKLVVRTNFAKRTLAESCEQSDSSSTATTEATDINPPATFMSPSKSAKLNDKMEASSTFVIQDTENVAPIVNLGSASFDEDDDQGSVTSKGSMSSVSTASSIASTSSRGLKRAASSKSKLGGVGGGTAPSSPARVKRTASAKPTRSASARSVL